MGLNNFYIYFSFILCMLIFISVRLIFTFLYLLSCGLYLLSCDVLTQGHNLISCNWKNKYKYKPGLIGENTGGNFFPIANFLTNWETNFFSLYL